MKFRKGSRYAVAEFPIGQKFTTFLDPTPRTKVISRFVEERANSKEEAFRIATKTANELVKYARDKVIYGDPEYFASPDTTLEIGAGDCEDFAFLLSAIVRGFEYYTPEINYVTVGVYKPRGWFAPSGYHAWCYADGWILEGTAGFITRKEDSRYHPMFGIDSTKIMIFKPIQSKTITLDSGFDIQSTAMGMGMGVATTLISQLVSDAIRKSIRL